MTEEAKVEGEQDSEYQKPDPVQNPRNIALAEIAKARATQAAEEAGETFPSIDDDGNITPAPEPKAPAADAAAEPAEGGDSIDGGVGGSGGAAAEDTQAGASQSPSDDSSSSAAPAPTGDAIDPNKMYTVEVDGVKTQVPGRKIIDAGFRTFQKETAADYRLQVASRLLEEAEQRAAASQGRPAKEPVQEPAGEASNEDLAKAIQFGTSEQAAEALGKLQARNITPEKIQGLIVEASRRAARDEVMFNDAMKFVQDEYGDLLSNDYMRRLFFTEENRRRAPRERGGEGDTRTYKDLYKAIGDDLRKEFARPKPGKPGPAATPPQGSAAARQERKAAAPPVPRTASARLSAQSDQATKAKTPSEIIAGMAASRGKNRLTQPNRKDQ